MYICICEFFGVGVLLSDLTFAEDGNLDSLHNEKSIINFRKREIIYR